MQLTYPQNSHTAQLIKLPTTKAHAANDIISGRSSKQGDRRFSEQISAKPSGVTPVLQLCGKVPKVLLGVMRTTALQHLKYFCGCHISHVNLLIGVASDYTVRRSCPDMECIPHFHCLRTVVRHQIKACMTDKEWWVILTTTQLVNRTAWKDYEATNAHPPKFDTLQRRPDHSKDRKSRHRQSRSLHGHRRGRIEIVFISLTLPIPRDLVP
jgi:hypothetical protein